MLDMSALWSAPDPRRMLEQVVRAYLAVGTHPDPDAILALLHPKFVYRTRGSWTRWPLAGPLDRVEFVSALGRILTEFEVVGVDVHDLLVDGASVAVHVTLFSRSRGASPNASIGVWVVLTFRGGLLAEECAYADVARATALAPDGLIEVRSGRARNTGRPPREVMQQPPPDLWR